MFSAIAVVGGFLGSVSIATMGQVQKMASEYPFSSYLREQRLFDLFFVLASVHATHPNFVNLDLNLGRSSSAAL